MISVVILAKNEEQNIGKCLESVKWCDEIIVIDDKSSDSTVEIAGKYKALVLKNPLNKNFSAQRNFALAKVKNEWALFVDSDEVVSDALSYEISNEIQLADQSLNSFSGYYIKRTDFMWGKQLMHGETGNMKLLRLGRKNSGVWEGMTHEKWEIKGRIGNLANPIFHFPHKTLEEFLSEINFYTDIRAKELKDKNTEVFLCSVFLYPLGKFIFNYFFKRGFMDGMQGLIFAITMSFHSFLARGKLWAMQKT